MINGKRAVLVYSKDDVDMALSGVDTKLTDFEKKLRQETIEQVNKIPERLIAGELADKVKDEIIAQMSSDMKQMKSDILEEVRKEIAASRPSH